MKNFGKTTDIRDIITVGYEADNAVLYSTSQSLTNDQKIQARANIGAGTSNFDGDYKSLANKPTIPTKTSQLDNDSNFATTSQVEAKYTKPSGGIPKTDLATAVQNSLTAADSAVRYTISQSLTDAQKDQARKNIGAGTSSFSGNYKDLADKPDIPDAVSIVQSIGESTSSVMSQKATTDAVNGRLSKTDNTNIEVLGTKKATTTLGGNQLYAPNGVIFGGTAAAAGLVTRGICGITTPSAGGACSKENLYINYDGNDDFNASRQIVLNASKIGDHLGSNMYQYAVPRGDVVKNWVEAKGYATSVKVNGNTIASSGGVVDIGTVLTDASKFATAAQGTKADDAMPKSGGAFTGNISVPETITFTGTTNPYIKMTTGGTDFYFQSTSGQFGLGPTWNKATHWDSNGNVTFPTTPKVGSSQLALKSDIHGGTLTIQKNGTNVATFGANQSTNETANITVPTKVSELTNDSGYTTNTGTVTQVKINGTTNSPDSAGLVDLGTVGGSSDNSKFDYTVLTNEDLNTVIVAGRYRAERGNTCAHNPIFGRPMPAFFLTVEKTGSGVVRQTAYVAEGIGNTYFQWYVRVSDDNGSSWAKWIEQQSMTGDYSQSFVGRKFFDNGIGISSSLQFSGDAGSSSQFAMSQGSSLAPKWVNLQVKVNGTTYTSDSDGLIDLGEISGGSASTSQYNDIY